MRPRATACDPVSLVYRKGLGRDGSAPLHPQGHGAYGFPHPNGSSVEQALAPRPGIVMAMAHVRGGGEPASSGTTSAGWSNSNSFTDFIAVAEHLVAEGYTSPERMIAEGGSAGGLLMGAVVQRRPDLFAAALVQVPFVDVINTMLDATLPLRLESTRNGGTLRSSTSSTTSGSTVRTPTSRARHIRRLLVRTAFNDSQVMYWEPAKYVARLRTLKTDSNPLLLVTNMGAGHGGASGRYDRLRERALDSRSCSTESVSHSDLSGDAMNDYFDKEMLSPMARIMRDWSAWAISSLVRPTTPSPSTGTRSAKGSLERSLSGRPTRAFWRYRSG